jgi:1-deoxy-D-xylulose-5-phosphate synthase
MHLSEITHPNQLHGLSVRQLQQIARQIRDKHLQTVAVNGGHLGPGLGVVELTLGLYQTLDLDRDKVIWDVGHQAYPHKLLTGRYDRFHTLRQKDGVAGYLKLCENKFDHFGAGHASTSISAALGMALARDLKGEKFKAVAVIGDGALTGGMALEAINHAGDTCRKLTYWLFSTTTTCLYLATSARFPAISTKCASASRCNLLKIILRNNLSKFPLWVNLCLPNSDASKKV